MEGWIKLHRKLFDHWLWDNKPKSKFEAWLWIIQRANHADNKFMFGNQLIDIKQGQIITSEKKMMSLFKWSKSKLRNFLKTLQKESMIEIFTDPKKTTLTVCNYRVYQEQETSKRPVKDHQKTSKRPVKDTNKNVKNVKNVKNEELSTLAPKPEDFKISDSLLKWSEKKGLSEKELNEHIEHSLIWHGAKGTKYKDWSKTIQNWILKDFKKKPNIPKINNSLKEFFENAQK